MVHGKQFGYHFNYEGKTQEHFEQINNNLKERRKDHFGSCGEYVVEGRGKSDAFSKQIS